MHHSAFNIGLLLFPRLTQLDLTGPAEVFGRMPGARLHFLWKNLEPVSSDRGLRILPSTTFDDCPRLDLICVPGGPGQVEMMEDATVLGFLQRVATGCRLVTSVCTGSLILGAAGLLRGYRATSHWSSIDQLAVLGAHPTHGRVVRDRNVVTGAGVTSGIDFALTVAADLFGADLAQEIQLQMEYDPHPPFDSGSLQTAPKSIAESVQSRMAAFLARRLSVSERVGKAFLKR
ncbi:DJ-1/PfpI family protein [Achromobacter aloeverae]|uniref:Thiamine biosynthesis protein ThiJ n=1 Tax=Achromobacter aloeverae TaxID=1750518 RepID=A0A4Q1HKQ7_9BURK|nr:DJ-1/PfpI family protein [Achromobacter aloeverae]RXN90997.1 thiamine biosynthesis protein ThiJ [Achromobacter aloeverae]